MTFTMLVHKMKCITCDLIFLVEKQGNKPNKVICPSCGDSQEEYVHHMEDILVVQEQGEIFIYE